MRAVVNSGPLIVLAKLSPVHRRGRGVGVRKQEVAQTGDRPSGPYPRPLLHRFSSALSAPSAVRAGRNGIGLETIGTIGTLVAACAQGLLSEDIWIDVELCRRVRRQLLAGHLPFQQKREASDDLE